MYKKWFVFVSVLLLLSFVGAASGETIAHWQFNGTSGQEIVTDADIVNGYVAYKFKDATYGTNAATDVFYGLPNPTYDSGGTSADFLNDPADNDPGVGFVVPDTGADTPLDLSTLGAFTIEAFIYPYTARQSVIVRKGQNPTQYWIDMGNDGAIRFCINDATHRANAGAVAANEWHHVAAVFDETDLAAPMKIYINGELKATAEFREGPDDSTEGLGIGSIIRDNLNPPGSSGQFFHGRIDEVRLSDEALSVDDFLLNAVEGAGRPSPVDGATDVPHDVVLSWMSSWSVKGHDVYFGTVREDVSNANRANPLGVLLSQGQGGNTYDPPGLLQIGQTYYWRVDAEVPADVGPGLTISKGEVWSFTVEPYSYVMDKTNIIIATASSSASDNTGPQKTIDGSGLNDRDLHSTNANDMWLSNVAGPQPTWIEYALDRIYKLHEMWVWNQNQVVESSIGFGVKDVTIEYSADGVDWLALGSFEFAQAPGLDDYAYNTTVDLGGVAARYVRLTVNSNWGGIISQYGLSEVRFMYVPSYAREPQPADEAVNVSVDTSLGWRAAREAALHEVYLSSDEKAVADGTTLVGAVSESSCDLAPLDLQLGATYYWKVNEVNEAAYPSIWEGETWTFSTQEYLVVDDFEDYDVGNNEIWWTWKDGLGYAAHDNEPAYPGNGTGSAVGDETTSSYTEETIVHGGRQSMPLSYDNNKQGSLSYSEATRTFDVSQDWTVHGADTLLLYSRGNPVAFFEHADGTILMSGAGVDIGEMVDEFRFAYKQLSSNGSIVARVDSLGNTHAWAKAGVMIRETLTLGSKFAAVYITPGNGCRFQVRTATLANATGDDDVATPEQIAVRAPYWVKLERSGNVFRGFYSADGTTWTPMAWNPQTVEMQGNVYVGLVVTSHNAGNPTTAVFSGVASTGNVAGPWQNVAIGFEQMTNDPAPLYVALEDNMGHVTAVTQSDETAVGIDAWVPWQIPLSTFTSAGVDVTRIKKLYIGVGARDNPTSGGAGLLYIDDIQLGRALAEPVPTIAHWQFNGTAGEEIVTDTDIQSGYVAYKFKDATYGTNAATDVFYGLPNPTYDSDRTSADFLNDPAGNDPGVGFVVPDTGADTPLDLSTLGAFTVEAFIYPYTARQSVIVRKYGGGGQYFIDLRPDGDVTFSINSGQNLARAGAGAVVANEWYHVAAVFDETDLAAPMKIYVNGELKGTAAFRDRPVDSTRGFAIGCIIRDNLNPPGNSGQFFNGLIDEVRLSAAALSADQFLLHR